MNNENFARLIDNALAAGRVGFERAGGAATSAKRTAFRRQSRRWQRRLQKPRQARGEALGFPVVLKIVSDDILHKTEAGGVIAGVDSAAEVRRGFDNWSRTPNGTKKMPRFRACRCSRC